MVTNLKASNREDWLQKRKQRIGGSEASAIVGMNPYMDNNDLWEIKTGRKEAGVSDNALMQYGRDAEPYIRELFRLDFPQYKVFYEDNNIWVNDKYPFAHASLDGWLEDENGRRGILEIKTTNVLSSMSREKWKGAVPQNYHIQVLHYMMVFEADFAVLKARLKFDYDGEIVLHERHYFFERYKLEADIKAIEEAERNFYQYVIEDKRPPLILPNI